MEKTGVPVVTTIMGRGAIPTNHPLFIGNLGMHGAYAANMDNLGVRGKFMKLSCDSVIKTCSNGKKYVTVAYSHIVCIGTVRSKHFPRQRSLSFWQAAESIFPMPIRYSRK